MSEPLIYEFDSREAWLAARRLGIGGSEVASVLGQAPPNWGSAWKVWAEKTSGQSLSDMDGNEAAEWGLEFERPIARRFGIRSGRRVELPPEGTYRLFVDPEYSWKRATPDAFQWPRPGGDPHLPDGEPGVLQVKCAGEYKRKEWAEGPPIWYEIQLQHEIAVTGVAWGSLIVLIGGNRLLGPFDQLRNEEFIQACHPHLARFWRGVEAKDPPTFDGSAASAFAITKLYKEDQGSEPVWLDDEAERTWAELREVQRQAEALETKENLLKAVIIQQMKTASVGLLPSGGQITYRTVKGSTFTVTRKPYRVLKGPK